MKRTSRQAAHLSELLHRQLNSYALAASAAGVGVLALAKSAEAKVVYTPAKVRLQGKDVYLIDLTHNGNANFILNGSRYSSIDRSASSRAVFPGTNYPNGAAQMWGAYPFASALKAGTKIGPDGAFAANANFMGAVVDVVSQKSVVFFGKWVNGGKGVKDRYLGLKFTIHNQDHFGWARLTTKIDAGKNPLMTTTLTGYAYETVANKPIVAGKTHGKDVITVQPASLGDLARGAAAIPAGRDKEGR
jgi:hypothetical protein